MCKYHYTKDLASRAGPCAFEGCAAPTHARGWCRRHYNAFFTAPAALPGDRGCSQSTCPKPHFGGDLCLLHYREIHGHSKRSPEEYADAINEKKRAYYTQVKDTENYQASAQRRRQKQNKKPKTPEQRAEINARQRAYYRVDEDRRLKAVDYSKQRRSCPKERARISANRRTVNCFFPPELVEACRALQEGRCDICRQVMDTETLRGPVNSENADHCHQTKTPRGLLCSSCNKVLGVYEKVQRPAGLRIEPYEQYLTNPPVTRLPVQQAAE
jgi:hypothetical protein